MKLIFVALIFSKALTGALNDYSALVNRILNQAGLSVAFVQKEVIEIPCIDEPNIYAKLYCLKRYFAPITREFRHMPARPMVLLPFALTNVMGSFSGNSLCPVVGPRGNHVFLTVVQNKDPEVTANIMAHEILHSFGARHQSEPRDVMYPYGALHRISEVTVGETTRRQVRRCLTRLRFLGRKNR